MRTRRGIVGFVWFGREDELGFTTRASNSFNVIHVLTDFVHHRSIFFLGTNLGTKGLSSLSLASKTSRLISDLS